MSAHQASEHALSSRVMLGIARVDITPPAGIYHGLWGAAPPHAASGVHRALFADVLTFAASATSPPSVVMCFVDHVNLEEPDCDRYRQAIGAAVGVPTECVILGFSHTHAGGFMNAGRVDFPGGDKIVPYLETLTAALSGAAAKSKQDMTAATITYAYGQCAMAANRDFWDAERAQHVCGYNPEGAADRTLLMARVTRQDGSLLCTIVNYGCHPTTLAWQNELVSPDYVGTTRALVEEQTGAPCIFIQGACGDLGPRIGFVGDLEVAERNGRAVGFAALSVLECMGPPGQDFHYAGPVVSGATIGTWEHRPHRAERVEETCIFQGGSSAAELPMLALSDAQTLSAEVQAYLEEQAQAEGRGDHISARDLGARAERARRWQRRVESLPPGEHYAFGFSVYRMGDAVWVATGGEPYSALQSSLRERFPAVAVVVFPLAGYHAAGYVLPRDRYGQGLYQEETTVLAPGALEMLTAAIAEAVERAVGGPAGAVQVNTDAR